MKIQNINVPFVQVPNSIQNEKKLSWKAKGIWAYIQSKPNDWDFSSERMSKDSADGLKSTRSGLKELEKYGFLIREKKADGTLSYKLSYKPEVEKAIVPKRLGAKTGPISNKEYNTNKELTTYAGKPALVTKRDPYEELPSLSVVIEELENDPRRHLNIIALYLDYRKKKLVDNLKTRGQLNKFITRHSKAAVELKVYDDGQLVAAFKKTEFKHKDIDWTLETVLKEITK